MSSQQVKVPDDTFATLIFFLQMSLHLHHDGMVSSIYLNRTKVITLAVAGTLRQTLATKEKVKTLTFLLSY